METSVRGGGGGGALKIVSSGTLTIGANIWACGGAGGARWNEARRSGGSGSGGAIYLKGDKVIINNGVTISADGGLSAKHTNGSFISSGNSDASDGGGVPEPQQEAVASTSRPPALLSTTEAPPMPIYLLRVEPVPIVLALMVPSKSCVLRLRSWFSLQEV